MIRVRYPNLVTRKAQHIAQWVNTQARNQRERDELCQRLYGLTHRYLSRVGTVHRSPSNRTLRELGFELIVRDKATGEEEVIQLTESET